MGQSSSHQRPPSPSDLEATEQEQPSSRTPSRGPSDRRPDPDESLQTPLPPLPRGHQQQQQQQQQQQHEAFTGGDHTPGLFSTSFAAPHAPPPTPAHTGAAAAGGDARQQQQQQRQGGVLSPSMRAAVGTPLPLAAQLTPPHRPATPPAAATGSSPSLPGSNARPSAPAGPRSNGAEAIMTADPPPAPAPERMKAWVVQKPSSVDDSKHVVADTQWPVTKPGAGQVRVKVICAGLNPVDFKRTTGLSPDMAPLMAFPAVMGCDFSGVVEALGDGAEAVTDLRPGDRVYGHNSIMLAHGSFAEYTICHADAISRVADNVTFADAAAVPCAGFTAFLGLFDKLRLQPGQTVLILGGAGGVGSFAVSLAKLCGCRVFATASSGSVAYVESLGADVVYDYKTTAPGQMLERLRQDLLSGGGRLDAVFDAVGAFMDAPTLAMAAEAVVFGGHLCTVLQCPNAGHESRFFSRQLSLHYVFLNGLMHSAETRPVMRSVGDSVMQLLAVGVNGKRLPSHLSELIQFSQVRQGLLTLRAGGAQGKIVMSFVPPAVAKRVPRSLA